MKYLTEVLRLFQLWNYLRSKIYEVTFNQFITVYNDMFHHIDGVMGAICLNDDSMERSHVPHREVYITEHFYVLY
jgi:hypothetical protein